MPSRIMPGADHAHDSCEGQPVSDLPVGHADDGPVAEPGDAVAKTRETVSPSLG
jgi:hypothetical protein